MNTQKLRIVVLLVLISLIGTKGFSAIIIDNSTSKSGNTNSLGWNHNISGTSTDRIIIVHVTTASAGVVTVSDNGVNLTLLSSTSNTGIYSSVWYKIAPPTGINSLQVDIPLSNIISAGAISLSGVEQTAPLSASVPTSGFASSGSITISSAPNDLALSFASSLTNTPEVSAGETELYNKVKTGYYSQGASKPGANSVTMTSTFGSPALPTFYTMIGVNVRMSTSLPVSLLSFSAHCKGRNAEINWSTASELNNDYFTLEKSLNGKDFFKLSDIKGAGTSSVLHQYSFSEESNSSAYYKLVQTDFDGKNTFFPVVSIAACASQNNYIRYVITQQGQTHFEFNSPENETGNYQILDLSGKIVLSGTLDCKKGPNTFELDNLNNGVYLFNLITASSIYTSKIIK